jgi:phosphoserine aminotransferase
LHYFSELSAYHLAVFLIGIRASLYNAVTEESVDALVKFIDEFVASHV